MVTVQMLLDVLPDITVYAGKSGLDRVIGSISFIDSPSSINWLSGGELILTTAFLYKENTEKQYSFVQKLIEMGVVSLGIKIGRHINDIPASITDLANLHNFSIWSLGFDTVWSEILTLYYKLRMDHKEERSLLSTEIITFEKLFRSSTWDIETIHTNFLKCVNISALIASEDYTVICKNNGECLSMLETYCAKQKYHSKDQAPLHLRSLHKQLWEIIDHPLYPGERLVVCADSETLQEAELEWIRLLYQNIRNKNKFMQDAAALWHVYVNECLFGQGEDNIIEYARILKLEKIKESAVMIFSGTGARQACDEFKRLHRSSISQGVAVIYETGITAGDLVLLYGKTKENNSYTFIKNLREALEKSVVDIDCQIWVGDLAQKPENIKLSCEQAQSARALGRLLIPQESIVFYQDIAIIDQLWHSRQNFSEISFLHQEITSFDSCETLEAYLECGNIKRAAECLFVNDNTMRYRIKKVEECLGVDLSKPLNRTRLLIETKLWRIDNAVERGELTV